jgi:TPR repeat protein
LASMVIFQNMKVMSVIILYLYSSLCFAITEKEAIDFYKNRTEEFTPLKAFNNFKELSELGNNNAKVFMYALFYEYPKKLEVYAAYSINSLAEAARAGDRLAQYNLGLILIRGLFVQKDMELGLTWLEKSAMQGEISSIELLGVTYSKLSEAGINSAYSEKAHHWLQQAVVNESEEPQIYLLFGMSVYDLTGDYNEATDYINKAKRLGDKGANDVLALLSQKHNLTRRSRMDKK